ncbi:hypothetical protein [Phenylobacterium sp.]|uniref:hypothetical protein n=1 Tax=Phenylobacterium sp. TaxID=1871053 RepID=UPI002DEBB9E8|nr:hypothetical protein [Phenylobacterium sp.]
MTVRQTKRLVLVASVLIALVVALNLGLFLWHRGANRDLFDVVMPLLFVVVMSSIWRRLSRLEAEHGPDYVEPTSRYARPLLIGLGALAVILGGVAAYLLATHR